MKKINRILSVIFIFFLAISFTSCKKNEDKTDSNSNIAENIIIKERKKSNEDSSDSNNKKINISKIEKKDSNTNDSDSKVEKINIKAFGDIMAHMGQVNYAKNYGKGNYDFSRQFEYIKEFVSDSDLAIGNFETSINPDKQPSGFPQFTSPAEYLKDIKDAGFDLLSTANNHTLDSEEKGIYDTIEAMDKEGIAHCGTRKAGESRIKYIQVKNMKIGFLSYTYGVNGLESLVVNHKPNEIINYLDEKNIEEDIKEARKNSDFIIVYPHWGIEYQSYPAQEHISLARNMIKWGADLVIGNHPHVVQPAERYKAENGKEGYIAYACGNFVSNQSLEALGDIRTEQSVAFDINVEKNTKTGKVKLGEVNFYPIWVGHINDEYGKLSRVYRTKDFLEGGKYFDKVDENQRARILKADQMVKETINTKVQ